jgi:L-ribulose-5-phosphate 3-epimerase
MNFAMHSHPNKSAFSRRQWLTLVTSSLGAAALAPLMRPAARGDEILPSPGARKSSGDSRPLGIFTHIVPGDHRAKAALVRAEGFACVQWYPQLDKDEFSEANFRRVASVYAAEGISIAAVAGYANLFDPRPGVRKAERDRYSLALRLAPACGCPLVCTETGTLNPLKAGHPDNTKPEIWREFVDLIGRYLDEADRAGSVVVLEAYTKNVCGDANDIARLLTELGTPKNLRFVMDPCNIVYEAELANMRPVLDRFFSVIGSRCVVAHAKDLVFEAGEKVTPRAGAGVFDWPYYAELLNQRLPSTPLILEHLKWPEVKETLSFVRKNLRQAGVPAERR